MEARPRTAVVATLLIVLCSGCGSSPPTDFHVLSGAALEPTVQFPDQMSLGVGPVTLPGYLERPQMVTRPQAHDLRVAEFDQWAEPLRDSAVRVLGTNLSALLDSDRVYAFPWEVREAPHYRVAIDVTRFEAASESTVMDARWTLVGPDNEVLAVKRFAFRDSVDVADYSAIAKGLSAALASLSREIAAAIGEAQPGGR